MSRQRIAASGLMLSLIAAGCTGARQEASEGMQASAPCQPTPSGRTVDSTNAQVDRIEDILPSERQVTTARLSILAGEIFQYACSNGRGPANLPELLAAADGDEFTRLRRDQLIDGWGTHFAYARTDQGRSFELRSAGPDRVFDTADDIRTASALPTPGSRGRRR